MITQLKNRKRKWSKFSMRTLIVLITFVCAYMACWRITATAGVANVIDEVYGYDNAQSDGIDFNPWTPMPMIVRLDEHSAVGISSIMTVRRYYLWYIVGSAPLPFQNHDFPSPEVGRTVLESRQKLGLSSVRTENRPCVCTVAAKRRGFLVSVFLGSAVHW